MFNTWCESFSLQSQRFTKDLAARMANIALSKPPAILWWFLEWAFNSSNVLVPEDNSFEFTPTQCSIPNLFVWCLHLSSWPFSQICHNLLLRTPPFLFQWMTSATSTSLLLITMAWKRPWRSSNNGRRMITKVMSEKHAFQAVYRRFLVLVVL